MELDFLEIGTSNFDTLIQTCGESAIGISVEPLKCYIDDLPNKPNVKKIQAAITDCRMSDTISIYYIPKDVITKHNIPECFLGCNTIGKYHPLHHVYRITQHVQIETVPLINIDELLISQNVVSIKYLKIDTEGHDTIILNGLFRYLKTKPDSFYPRKILFETNSNTPAVQVDEIIQVAITLGYKVVSRGHDTLLELTQTQHAEQYASLTCQRT